MEYRVIDSVIDQAVGYGENTAIAYLTHYIFWQRATNEAKAEYLNKNTRYQQDLATFAKLKKNYNYQALLETSKMMVEKALAAYKLANKRANFFKFSYIRYTKQSEKDMQTFCDFITSNPNALKNYDGGYKSRLLKNRI